MTQAVADAVRDSGLIAIVTNDTWRRLPTAAVLFAANAIWWTRRRPRVSPELHEFAGERICSENDPRTGAAYVAPRKIRTGGNSALRATHLAEDRGAARCLLFGVDLRDDAITHWHGQHQGLDNPNEFTFKRHRRAWAEFAAQTKMEIWNGNPDSGLDCFPKVRPEDLLGARIAA
jgi:hypothetical protein